MSELRREREALVLSDGDDVAFTLRRVQSGDPRRGQRCPFCCRLYVVGDLIKEVPSGPADAAELLKAKRGLPYASGPPMVLHYDCGDPSGSALSNGEGQ